MAIVAVRAVPKGLDARFIQILSPYGVIENKFTHQNKGLNYTGRFVFSSTCAMIFHFKHLSRSSWE